MVVHFRSHSGAHVCSEDFGDHVLPDGNGLWHRKKSNEWEGSSLLEDRSLTSLESQLQNCVTNASQQRRCKIPSSPTTVAYRIFFVTILYYIYSLQTQVTQRDNELRTIRNDFDIVEDALVQNESIIKSEQKKHESLLNQLKILLPVNQRDGLAKGEELYRKIVERQGVIVHRINDLQNSVAELDRRETIEHFGPGPYRVGFNLLENGETFSFVVELAELEFMPHSVHYFMRMVDKKVWDNTIFHHQSNHILYAQLMDSGGNDKRYLLSEKNVPSKLSFPEYTDRYPHHKYTLGFSGRPGGPEFYINTDNNSVTHGPGGQVHHDLHEEADPCFGTVIEGHQVVDWLHERTKSAIQAGHDEKYTVIKSIRILR